MQADHMADRDQTFFDALRDLAADQRRPPIGALREVWPTLAGDTFAARTRPVAWRPPATLVLTAASEAWLKETARHRSQLLQRLNRRLPFEIEAIELTDHPSPGEFDQTPTGGSGDAETNAADSDAPDENTRLDDLRDRLDPEDLAALERLPDHLRKPLLKSHPALDDD